MTTAMAMKLESATCPRRVTAATAVRVLSPSASGIWRVVCEVFMPL